jgi:DNA-binding transcriptional LysR family regulator
MRKSISWDDQRCFLAVLDGGSLSAAARQLGVSQPTIRARIEALERAVGVMLFTRSVKGLTPTDDALSLRDSARTMALASEMFMRQASGPFGEISGTVRLSVPEFIGVEVLPRMLLDVRRDHPKIDIELVLSNVPADILAQEVDIAVRTIQPRQQALVAKKVAAIPLGFFASHAYLARNGTPQCFADLAQHALIGPDRNAPDLAVAKELVRNFTVSRWAIRTDSHPAQLAAARVGLGVVATQIPVGDADPNLRRVLPDLTVATLQIWVVMHENLQAVPRVRAVFDALVTAFAATATAKTATAKADERPMTA